MKGMQKKRFIRRSGPSPRQINSRREASSLEILPAVLPADDVDFQNITLYEDGSMYDEAGIEILDSNMVSSNLCAPCEIPVPIVTKMPSVDFSRTGVEPVSVDSKSTVMTTASIESQIEADFMSSYSSETMTDDFIVKPDLDYINDLFSAPRSKKAIITSVFIFLMSVFMMFFRTQFASPLIIMGLISGTAGMTFGTNAVNPLHPPGKMAFFCSSLVDRPAVASASQVVRARS